jgi:membrane protein YdbS with pleckstrin-like domain
VPDATDRQPTLRPEPIADGRERRLDPRAIVVERLAGAVVGGVFALVSLIGAVVFAFRNPFGVSGALLGFGGWGALSVLLAAWIVWWPALRYRRTSYVVSDESLVIRRGVWWRAVHTVPRSRVQHTDVSQGPIERAWELATLVVYTAGTEHASISLSGLRHETANAIRDHLVEGGTDDAV